MPTEKPRGIRHLPSWEQRLYSRVLEWSPYYTLSLPDDVLRDIARVMHAGWTGKRVILQEMNTDRLEKIAHVAPWLRPKVQSLLALISTY